MGIMLTRETTLTTILSDYQSQFTDVLGQLHRHNISIHGYPLSHIGMRTETVAEYEAFKQQLLPLCSGYVENEHNGRPISKLDLQTPLQLPQGFKVSLIELMPPKPDKHYPTAIEHWGVVIGPTLPAFAQTHKSALTGQQDQGPYCQPYFITFPNGKRVKFYDLSLKDVVLKEGGIFQKR